MTLSDLIQTLTPGILVAVNDSTNALLIKFTTSEGASGCFSDTFLAKEVAKMQLTGNSAMTITLASE